MPLPKLGASGWLKGYFCGEDFVSLLPLVDIIKQSKGPMKRGPLGACFMFDDPNLHSARYGYVDYALLAKMGEHEHFHTTIATVPFDAWYANPTAVRLFRENPSRLSLLVHGNNHLRRELGQQYQSFDRRALLFQAIKRIERLERSTGLTVSRVMAAPHGACTTEMLEELPKCFFEGATISHGSMRAHNSKEDWVKEIGFTPSEFVRDCPVFPRWRMDLKSKADLLIAHYLNQPIILVGHHWDLKHGVEFLSDLASFINGLGLITWCSADEIFSRAYGTCCRNSLLTVYPNSRKVTLRVTDDIRSVSIVAPRTALESLWSIESGPQSVCAKAGTEVELKVPADSLLTVRLIGATHILEQKYNIGIPVFAKAAVRRFATEFRDRVLS